MFKPLRPVRVSQYIRLKSNNDKFFSDGKMQLLLYYIILSIIPNHLKIPFHEMNFAFHSQPIPTEYHQKAVQMALCSISDDLRSQLVKTIDQTKKIRQYGQIFAEPVDYITLQLTDYLDVVKRPMDLSTLRTCLVYGEYSCVQEFITDSQLVWANCRAYNGMSSDGFYAKASDEAEKFFVSQLQKISQLSYLNLQIYRFIAQNPLTPGQFTIENYQVPVITLHLMCKQWANLPDNDIIDLVQQYKKTKEQGEVDHTAKTFKVKLDQSDCLFLRDFHRKITRRSVDDKKLGK